MSNDLAVQPAIVIFDKGRAEACGVAPVGVADPTFFAPITKAQRDAGGVRGVAVNDAGLLVDADGTVGGVPVGAVTDELTGGIELFAGGSTYTPVTAQALGQSGPGQGADMVGYGDGLAYADGTVGAAIQERLPEIGTYALLRAYTGSRTAFFVRGMANVFDGGFGVFRVDAADTTTADNGGTVLVDASGRRWKRDFADAVNIKWFGANPGASAPSNNTAIQAALNSGESRIFVPDGVFLYTSLTWTAGAEITGTGTLKRTGTPTAAGLNAASAGTYRVSGVTFDDGGHSAQYGCIETNHASAKLYVSNVFATNGYAGIWAKQAAVVDIDGGEYWDTSHNLYFGDNNPANLPGTIERVTVRGVVSRNARTGGDGLKTVSGVKRMTVIGGRFFGNAQDGMDLFGGCDEAMLIGVESFGNGINGVDIKIGAEADYPKATWGQRRRVAIIGGYYEGNGEVGIKVFGDTIDGYYQDVLIQSANILGNQVYGIHCRGVAPRILGNLLLGNALSAASNYSVIYMQGDATVKPKGGVVAHNTIGNNGVAGKVNAGINVFGWDGLLIDGNIIGNTADRVEAQELDIGINVDVNSVGVHVVNNQMGACNTNKLSLAGGSCILGINPGVPLKTRGTLTINSGATSATANHGAAGRPAPYTQVRFFPLGTQAGAGFPYPSATSTTQITATVSAAPSANISVGWEVDLTGETNTYAVVY